MTVPGGWIDHVWQSTLFAVAAGVLTLAFKRNHPRVRYWLWFSASIKFLLPFSLLVTVGRALPWRLTTSPDSPAFSSVITRIGQPLLDVGSSIAAAPALAPADTDWLAFALLTIWACGAAAVLNVRFTMWGRVRAALRASTPVAVDLTVPSGVRVRTASGVLEPGVVGLWRPVILLPAGIDQHLTPAQLDAVLAHELCHIRRRDNLLATLHMLVETMFWFHPLVWWIGGRLIDERERACDEDVLRLHGAPLTYAEGIIRVCERYVDARLACVSGVSGSNLKQRIEAILRNQTAERLSAWKTALLASATAAMAISPIVVGTFDPPTLQAPTRVAGDLAFDVATIEQNAIPTEGVQRAGRNREAVVVAVLTDTADSVRFESEATGTEMRMDDTLKAVTSAASALLLSAQVASAQAPAANTSLERQLEEALVAGPSIAGLEVTVASNIQQLNRAEYRVPVIVRIEPASALAASGGNGSQIELVGIVRDPAGFVSHNFRDRVVLDAEQATAATSSPVAYSAAFTMLPGRYSVKVAVMNAATGLVGTAETPFVIRNLARNAPQP